MAFTSHLYSTTTCLYLCGKEKAKIIMSLRTPSWLLWCQDSILYYSPQGDPCRAYSVPHSSQAPKHFHYISQQKQCNCSLDWLVSNLNFKITSIALLSLPKESSVYFDLFSGFFVVSLSPSPDGDATCCPSKCGRKKVAAPASKKVLLMESSLMAHNTSQPVIS